MLLVALAVPGLLPGLLPAQACGPASCLHPDRRRSRASKAAAAAAARPSPDGPVTFRAADAAAEAGLAVTDALRADGVVRVDGILTREMAAAVLECVEASLGEALHETRGHEPFGTEWNARFGDIMKPCHRHDVKLGLEAPAVREDALGPGPAPPDRQPVLNPSASASPEPEPEPEP